MKRWRCPASTAAILTSPTQMHTSQAVQVMRAGKHVEIEIPIADSLADAEQVLATQKETGKIAMAGHTRRFNPSHQWVHNRIEAGELKLQHLVVQTFFFRRQNINLEGKPRSWTDHLLWHHACHTVDLFHHQTGETAQDVFALQGPIHPELKIAMDMSIGMQYAVRRDLHARAVVQQRRASGHVLPVYLRQRHLPRALRRSRRRQGTADRSVSGVDVSMNGIELQDREFTSAIAAGREPRSSVAAVLPAMRVLDRLEKCLDG